MLKSILLVFLAASLVQLVIADSELVYVDGVLQTMEEADAPNKAAHTPSVPPTLTECPHLSKKSTDPHQNCPYAGLISGDWHDCSYLKEHGCPFSSHDHGSDVAPGACPFAEKLKEFGDVFERCPHLKERFSASHDCPYASLVDPLRQVCPYLKGKSTELVQSDQDPHDKKKSKEEKKKQKEEKKKDKKKDEKKHKEDDAEKEKHKEEEKKAYKKQKEEEKKKEKELKKAQEKQEEEEKKRQKELKKEAKKKEKEENEK